MNDTVYMIGRPIKGVSLNGDEYLLDRLGNPIFFDSPEDAKKYAYARGLTEADFENGSVSIVPEKKKLDIHNMNIKINKLNCTEAFMKSLNEFLKKYSKSHNPKYPVSEKDRNYIDMVTRSAFENGSAHYELPSRDSKSGHPEHFEFEVLTEREWNDEYKEFEFFENYLGAEGEFDNMESVVAEKGNYSRYYINRKKTSLIEIDLRDMTDSEYDEILKDILEDEVAVGELLSIPGVYELLSEHYNNEIISRWKNGIISRRKELKIDY